MIINNNKTKDDVAVNGTDSTTNHTEFKVGQEIEVKVTGIKPFGAFFDCGGGYTGLAHISRITTKYVKDVNDYFKVGDTIKVKIVDVKEGEKKLGLSTIGYDIEPQNNNSVTKKGFKGLETKLDSWVKEDSNK